jgi:carboxyl-terminal processing protease
MFLRAFKIIIFFFLFLQNFTAKASLPKTDEEYWRDTDLTFSTLIENYETFCKRDAIKFAGCMTSLNELARRLPQPQILATAEEASALPRFIGASTGVHFGRLSFYKRKVSFNDSMTEKQKWELFKTFRTSQFEFMSELFRERESQSIDFDKLSNYMKTNLVTGDHASDEAYFAAIAMNALIGAVNDAHSRLEPAQQLEDSQNSKEEKLKGVGAILYKFGSKILFGELNIDGPAAQAGIKEGDELVSVNDQEFGGDIGKLRNIIVDDKNNGRSVKLKVKRKQSAFITVEVVPAEISFNNVSSKIVIDGSFKIGIIKLSNFLSNQTCNDIKSALTSFKSEKVNQLIFDLRNNGGGDIYQALCVGTLFMGREVIFYTSDGKSKPSKSNFFSDSDKYYVGQEDAFTDLPMVTLINSGSASASEAIAGSLQDHQRSWIAGDTSFGKATVQGSRYVSDSIISWETEMRLFEPSGRTHQKVGIIPDFKISTSVFSTEDEEFALREGDYFVNALDAIGPVWKQTRPSQVEAINNCVTTSRTEKRIKIKLPGTQLSNDNQMMRSIAILECSNKG